MKKIFNSVFLFLLGWMLVSCSGNSDKPKTITPTTTEFSSGELARYIKIVDEPCEITFNIKDGFIEQQIIRLKTQVELTKDGVKAEDFRDIHFTRLISVATLNLIDENGVEIQDLSISDESTPNLKKLLLGNVGDKQEIIFEGVFSNSVEAPKWFEKAIKFTPNLTGDIDVENYDSNESSAAQEETVQEATPAEPEKPSIALEDIKLPSSLKGKVEVIEADKHVGDYGFPTIDITFKLLQTVNTTPLCSAYGQMWLVGVGQNEKGGVVRELLPSYDEWRTDDSDGNEFKTFLESEPGETISMSFTGSDDNYNVEEDLKKVVKFKLKITN